MADKPAAPAPAQVAPAAASRPGAETASSSPAPATAPELLASSSFDVEELMAGPAAGAEPVDVKPTDGPEDDETLSGEEASSAATPAEEEPEGASAAEDEDKPEVVEEEGTGKKLIGVRHFNRLLKQRNEAKAALRDVETRLAEALKAPAAAADKPVITTDMPLQQLAPEGMDLNNAQHVAQLETVAQRWLDWCERHPLGGAPTKDGEEWNTEQVVDQKIWAQQVLKAVPEHQKFQTDFAAERAKVRASNPALFQEGTEERKAYTALQQKLLNFRTAPDQDAIIARLIKAEQAENEAQQGVRTVKVKLGKPAPVTVATTKPAPKAAAPATPLPAVRAGASPAAKLGERLRSENSMDLEELYAAAG